MNLKPVAVSIRNRMPIWLRDRIFRLGLFCGDMLFPDLRNTLRVLRDRGFKPEFAIDIGAYHGKWTRDFLSILPDCHVLMIEAQEKGGWIEGIHRCAVRPC